MMKEFVEVVVVIPVGRAADQGFLADTIESYMFYACSSYKIILADESDEGIGFAIQKCYTDVDVFQTKELVGGRSGSYKKLASVFRYALDNYQFKVLLKLDTDALVIGPRPEFEALELFERDPKMGIAGQFPLDYQENEWNIAGPRKRLCNGNNTWRYIRRPYTNWFLRKLYRRALANGYTEFESASRGAYFINVNCLAVLMKEGLLPDSRLENVSLNEDYLLALLIKSTGYKLGALSAGGEFFTLAHNRLPAQEEQLVNDVQQILHSTRHRDPMNEQDIRARFKKMRDLQTRADVKKENITVLPDSR